ncbi:MAG: hypothetical protein ABJA82_02370 [Myxococcales bacterium]
MKITIGLLGMALGLATVGVSACGSSNSPGSGTPSGASGGMTGSSGGMTAGGGGGTTGTGGAGGSSTSTGSGGAGGASTMTLEAACTKNCSFAAGLTTDPAGNVAAGCATTMAVCVDSCLKTFDNTAAIKADLGRQYKAMMICVATDPKFSSSSAFVCAKPERALNKWSPGPGSDDCEQLICDWNCADGTKGNFDPFVDIRCMCSSV